ncbi:PEP-CTERM sorting domain-containing protein [Polymorphobacter arshaanensis]|uniref:PEP-CTERM sorting domain-containing protein n=1 Tax=Glacieibacterium arshaanense TaxID=2511025 RepID=A0A4Y9ELQ5_9SPHN|nr:PEPxxWA-CTERM sorting domain-containing protein [Polymorphobacter arshaanensis]TFU01376.1 PEP-CTERM sorting domain-containing protein [Polymorphobacter arshaanensis]
MRKRILIASALASSTVAYTPATATVATIAIYNQVVTGSTMRWVRAPSGVGGQLYTISSSGSTTPGAASVDFSFLKPVLAALGPVASKLTLTATSSVAATPVASFLAQTPVNGSFAFTYAGAAPLTVGFTTYNTGANLLSGTFTNATIVGGTGGTSGSFSASTGAGSIIALASDFLDFSGATNFDFSIGFNAMTSPFGVTNAQKALNSFRGATGGSFGSDSATVTATIPEPASWALMVTGFGGLGVALRRRRKQVVTA